MHLGFDGNTSPAKRALCPSMHRPEPPLVGHPAEPFLQQPVPAGYICEFYSVHGLSLHAPELLTTNAALRSTRLKFMAIPMQPPAVAYCDARMQEVTARAAELGVAPPQISMPQSEVIVILGLAVIPQAHPGQRYMLSWQPEAPWLGLTERGHETALLTAKEMQSLFSVGRELLGINFRGRPKGSGRFESREDLEQAVFAAVDHLLKRKRPITQDTVGAYIIAKRGRNRNAGDSAADPGRQFRELCEGFGVKPADLIQHATAACANEE
jgi:hypothetical protein